MVAGLAGFTAQTYAATGYPDRLIKWVVPFAAGGGMDAITRFIATEMAPKLQQPIVIENRVGAGGTIGARFVVNEPADGYTILTIDGGGYTTAHLLRPNLSYSAPRDLRLVATLVQLPVLLVVGAGHPTKTFQEFIAFAKANPGMLDYASVGPGGQLHVGMEMLARRTDVKLNYVPFRSMGDILIQLSTGVIGAALVDYGSVKSFLDSGKVRALAAATEERLPMLSTVPTFGELGVTNLPISLWAALAAPKKTPDDVVDVLANGVQQALESPAVKVRMDAIGAQNFYRSGPAAIEFGREQGEFWAPLIKSMGLKLD